MFNQQLISDKAFKDFRSFIYDVAGIDLSDDKKTLVTSRLGKRLRHYDLKNFSQYFDMVVADQPQGERQTCIDLLTTNETYFFREPEHFQFLRKEILANWRGGRAFRVWSAASSSGEEAYSIAMTLDDVLGTRLWEILGSDISSRVLKKAARGHYAMSRIEGISKQFLRTYCLQGMGEYAGTMLIDKNLRKRVSFFPANLKEPLPEVGLFDVIFLRNVLIYFDKPTKQLIINQLADKLVPGGYLLIGHSETLKGICDKKLVQVKPTVYQRPAEASDRPVLREVAR